MNDRQSKDTVSRYDAKYKKIIDILKPYNIHETKVTSRIKCDVHMFK
jgi:hypothetical protein